MKMCSIFYIFYKLYWVYLDFWVYMGEMNTSLYQKFKFNGFIKTYMIAFHNNAF